MICFSIIIFIFITINHIISSKQTNLLFGHFSLKFSLWMFLTFIFTRLLIFLSISAWFCLKSVQRNGGNGTLWTQKTARNCLFIVESHRIVWISTNFIIFKGNFWDQYVPLRQFLILMTCTGHLSAFCFQKFEFYTFLIFQSYVNSNFKYKIDEIALKYLYLLYYFSIFKVKTPSWNCQQLISYKFPHYHHKMDIYCQVMQNKNLFD